MKLQIYALHGLNIQIYIAYMVEDSKCIINDVKHSDKLTSSDINNNNANKMMTMGVQFQGRIKVKENEDI